MRKRHSPHLAILCGIAGLLALPDAAPAKDNVTGPTFGQCSLSGGNWDCEGGIICSCCDTTGLRMCWICEAEGDRPVGGTCDEQSYKKPPVTVRPGTVGPNTGTLDPGPKNPPNMIFQRAPGTLLTP